MKWYPEFELEVCHEVGVMRATLRAEHGKRFVDYLTAKRVESIYSLEGDRLTVYICTEEMRTAHDLIALWMRGREGMWGFGPVSNPPMPLTPTNQHTPGRRRVTG